jgi:asparagine synthase (glutamine-hydrolysing)
MCGIFSFFQKDPMYQPLIDTLIKCGKLCAKRGPDNTSYLMIPGTLNKFLLFNRLMINDLTVDGNQPFTHDGISMICNGEIYNYKELEEEYEIKTNSNSDCEVILHLYKKHGFQKTVSMLDGVFSIILTDGDDVYVARDPIGVRSLYVGYSNNRDNYGFASELKCLHTLFDGIEQFPPGHIWTSITKKYMRYYDNSYKTKKIFPIAENNTDEYDNIKTSFYKKEIYKHLTNSVEKRMISDREVGCLLSGGFDSSIITALVVKMNENKNIKIKTFSIGLENSEDLKYAKIVANFLNTDHHEVILTETEMLNGIINTIRDVETYDITTIRASVPMYLLCKYVTENTNVKVLFSGEGSDEASGSYLYFHNAPSVFEFKKETNRLLNDLSYFDVLRCDKSVSSHGIEVRVPFLDKQFLDFYMTIDPSFKIPSKFGMEKHLLRSSFDDIDLLPDNILWRVKEGMSDGVSSKKRSWFEIIQEFTENLYTNKEFKKKQNTFTYLPPQFKEALYYREIYEKIYKNRHKLIPYYWLPKWSGEIVDPSARILNVYKKNDN